MSQWLTCLAEFLDVGGPCIAQFQALCETLDKELLLGWSLATRKWWAQVKTRWEIRDDTLNLLGFHCQGCHRAIFHTHFFNHFLNLVTHTLVHLFHFTPAIFAFHLAFMLSTCITTNDSHEPLWLDDYTLHFILILLSHSFIRWNEDLIDFFETSDGYN